MKKIVKFSCVFVLLVFSIVMLTADGMPKDTKESASDSFFKAVKRGDVAGAKGYLDTNQVSINAKDANGNTALMIAVDNVDLPMVIALITYKPDTNAKNAAGETVMDIAAKKGNVQLTTALKNAGF